MKHLLKTISLAGAILLCVASVRAQDAGRTPVAKRKFNHRAEIVSVYDEAKDHTSVIMQWYRIPSEEPVGFRQTDPPEFSIWAGFGYAGRVLKSRPPAVEFHVGATYEGASFYKGKEMPELIAVVDGERVSLGKTVLLGSRTATTIERQRQLTREVLAATFTYEGLLRLAHAKKVGMKVGRLEFELKERHLEALRDLASRMEP